MDRISLGYQKTMYFADRIVVPHTSISRPTIPKSNMKFRVWGTSKWPHVPLALSCSTNGSKWTKKRIRRQQGRGPNAQLQPTYAYKNTMYFMGRIQLFFEKQCVLRIDFEGPSYAPTIRWLYTASGNVLKTQRVLYVALTVIAIAQTHGVCQTRRAPLLFGAEVENECTEEEKRRWLGQQ